MPDVLEHLVRVVDVVREDLRPQPQLVLLEQLGYLLLVFYEHRAHLAHLDEQVTQPGLEVGLSPDACQLAKRVPYLIIAHVVFGQLRCEIEITCLLSRAEEREIIPHM